jgi:hypothetical protein
MLRLNSRRAQAKVLIVVLTAALFESKPCLKEMIEAVEKGFFGATNSRHDFALWR